MHIEGSKENRIGGNNKLNSVTEYHLEELQAAQDASDDRRINPSFKEHQKAILDIGCGIGQTFIGTGIYKDPERHLIGIDIDIEQLRYGKSHYGNVTYINSSGDSLPIVTNSMDLVFSRVSLPYVHIPTAIKEISRVLKIDGEIWITLHPFEMTLKHLWQSLKSFHYKDVIFRSYVILNGFLLHFFGTLIRFPVKGIYESFQTEKAIRSLLEKEHFANIEIVREGHFLVRAVKKA